MVMFLRPQIKETADREEEEEEEKRRDFGFTSDCAGTLLH